MALEHTVKHAKISLKPDGADASKVQPTDWNADHQVVFTCGADVLLGRAGSSGPVQELALGAGLVSSGGAISAPSALPVGTIVDFGGSSAPTDDWLLCDGALHGTGGQNAALFAVLGYTFGGSGGSFATPDLRGRATFGRDSMGGTAANRVTDAESGIDGVTLGETGGVQSVVLTVDQLPIHSHGDTAAGGHAHYVVAEGTSTGAPEIVAGESIVQANTFGTGAYALDAVSAPAPSLALTSVAGHHTHGSGEAGDGDSHTNMPPAMMITKIIYRGPAP